MSTSDPGGASTIRVETDARMSDRSGHEMQDMGDAESYLDVVLIAFDKACADFSTGNLNFVAALQSYALSFQSVTGDNHHLKEIGATLDGGKAWMLDSAGHTVTAGPDGSELKLGAMEGVYYQRFSGDTTISFPAETADYAILLVCFAISKKGDGIHIRNLGASATCSASGSKIETRYTLEDKHENKASKEQCGVSGYFLACTKKHKEKYWRQYVWRPFFSPWEWARWQTPTPYTWTGCPKARRQAVWLLQFGTTGQIRYRRVR